MATFRCAVVSIAFALLPAMPGCAAPPDDAPRNEAMPTAVVARSEKPIVLAAKPVRVTLKNGPVALSSRVERLPRGRRIYLVISGLRADRQPGAGFDVYLELPAEAAAAQRARHHVGNIHFFDAQIGATGSPDARFSFDVTDLARTLRSRGVLRETTTVTIAPSDGTPSGKPVVGRIELVEQ